MAGLLAVGIAILLAIVMSVSYALVLRELRQINANLEQLIGLWARDEAMPKAPREDIGWNPKMSTGVSFSTGKLPGRDSHAGRGFSLVAQCIAV